MSKTLAVSIAVIAITLIYTFTFLGRKQNTAQETSGVSGIDTAQPTYDHIPADTIEVVNFFGTQRCVSCIKVGQFTKKTLEEKFSEELKSGRIVFKEINGELPENENIVIKYQARGSSLFINAIQNDADEIIEDVTVWRHINDEAQFSNYLEKKLLTLLGK